MPCLTAGPISAEPSGLILPRRTCHGLMKEPGTDFSETTLQMKMKKGRPSLTAGKIVDIRF